MRTVIVLSMLVLIASAAPAEILELANGDRIQATVIQVNNEAVTFEHPVLGVVTLPAGQVTVLTSDAAEAVADAEVAASELDAADVPEPTPGATAAEPADEAAAPEAVAAPDRFGIPFLAGWDRRFELGLDGSEGNSETFNIRAAVTADFADDDDRYHLGAGYVRKTTDSETTENEFFAEAIRDWLVPGEKYFYFAQVRYEYDDFEAWRHRLAPAGGIGYQFVETDEFILLGRLGAGLAYQWGGEEGDDLTPEGLIGVEGKWNVRPGHAFEFKNTLFPDLGEFGEYRNLTTLGYVIELDQAQGLSLKFGLENEYESETGDDSKHNDLSYFAALVFDF